MVNLASPEVTRAISIKLRSVSNSIENGIEREVNSAKCAYGSALEAAAAGIACDQAWRDSTVSQDAPTLRQNIKRANGLMTDFDIGLSCDRDSTSWRGTVYCIGCKSEILVAGGDIDEASVCLPRFCPKNRGLDPTSSQPFIEFLDDGQQIITEV